MIGHAELHQIAQRFGLTLVEGAVRGTVDGQRISVSFAYERRQGVVTVVRGWLDPPLDLGLEVHRRAIAALIEPRPLTGYPDLDVEFVIQGDERARVKALFCPELCDRLATLHRSSYELRVQDAGCTLYGSTNPFAVDLDWLAHAIPLAAQTVWIMDRARRGVPAAWRLTEHAAALRAHAQLRGLRYGSTPLRVEGKVEGRSLRIGAIRTGSERYHVAAHAELEAELGVGLHVRRQGVLDSLASMFGGQDVLVGDAPFDTRFLLHAEPQHADRVATLLDAGTRAALLAIDARIGPVVVDDRGVTVEPITVSHAPEDLIWLLDTLTEVTGQIGRNLLHGGGEAGPYR